MGFFQGGAKLNFTPKSGKTRQKFSQAWVTGEKTMRVLRTVFSCGIRPPRSQPRQGELKWKASASTVRGRKKTYNGLNYSLIGKQNEGRPPNNKPSLTRRLPSPYSQAPSPLGDDAGSHALQNLNCSLWHA